MSRNKVRARSGQPDQQANGGAPKEEPDTAAVQTTDPPMAGERGSAVSKDQETFQVMHAEIRRRHAELRAMRRGYMPGTPEHEMASASYEEADMLLRSADARSSSFDDSNVDNHPNVWEAVRIRLEDRLTMLETEIDSTDNSALVQRKLQAAELEWRRIWLLVAEGKDKLAEFDIQLQARQ
jgi:hypothetical protein